MPRERRKTVLQLPLNSADHILGPASASVTVIEYGDFQCPYCRAIFPAVKILLKHFQDRVRFAFRHFPVVTMHPHAERAAESAETAGAQGKFWPMHDLLFENQQRLGDNSLRQYARQAELDLPRYDQDMETRVHLPFVYKQMNSGKERGARGTPTFFVNGVIEDVSFGMDGLYKAIEANLQSVNLS
ncbi:MAG: DsbA family protein [Sulfuricaulis sp.]